MSQKQDVGRCLFPSAALAIFRSRLLRDCAMQPDGDITRHASVKRALLALDMLASIHRDLHGCDCYNTCRNRRQTLARRLA